MKSSKKVKNVVLGGYLLVAALLIVILTESAPSYANGRPAGVEGTPSVK